MVEPAFCHFPVDRFHMGVEIGSRLASDGSGINKAVEISCPAMIGRAADDAAVFGAARLHVEIAHPDRRRRVLRLGLATGPVARRLIVRAAPRASLERR